MGGGGIVKSTLVLTVMTLQLVLLVKLKDHIFNGLYRGSAPVDRVKYGVLNIGR